VLQRFISLAVIAVAFAAAYPVAAQQPPEEKKPEQTNLADSKATSKNSKKKAEKPKQTDTKAVKDPTPDQVAETVVAIYGGLGGRNTLNQIRKTSLERGKMSVTNAEGKVDQASYQRWTQRSDSLDKEKIRLEQDFPNARYSLVFNSAKIFGIYNDSVFTPREDASKAFENQIVHGIEALLRYKENGSTIALAGKEKRMGVEYHLVDVTDKAGRKTRYFISVRTFRVMALEYEDGGKKYRRQFYDYNYAQGTLVPYRTVLYEGDKIVEETEIGTITYGQKIEDSMFSES
jgi:hypothetical protein